MENNTIFDSNYQPSNSEGLSIGVRNEKTGETTREPSEQIVKTIKRDNDSMDDFEHLEHESSPCEDPRNEVKNILDATSVQLIDLPANPSKMSDNQNSDGRPRELTNLAGKLERNILDTSIPADEKILQPVPATPPPSASYEKHRENVERCEEKEKNDGNEEERAASAQTSSVTVAKDHPKDQHYTDNHHHHHYQIQTQNIKQQDKSDKLKMMDSKAATMAFMETERGDLLHSEAFDVGEKSEERETASKTAKNPESDVSHGAAVDTREIRDNTVEEWKNETSAGKSASLPHGKTDEKWAIDSGIDDTSVYSTSDKTVSPTSKNVIDDLEKSDEALRGVRENDFSSNVESSVLPKPQKSPDYDFLAGEISPNLETKGQVPTETKNLMDDDTWNVIERPEVKNSSSFGKKEIENDGETFKAQREHYNEAPTRPLPPVPKNHDYEDDGVPVHADYERERLHDETFEMSNDFLNSGSGKTRGQQHSGTETGDSEFESAPEQSPAKTSGRSSSETVAYYAGRKVNADDIAPKEIFADMGLDAWFNPERLNPKVAALIYWRQPEKTGVVFGAILGVLLSLAYFSLISVFAYLSLLTLCVTVGFRVYKTFMQAVQKTSDGHPFKDILELDLTLPAEKVHVVADVAVAHANAAVAELRRLFLVEDFIDSLKFGVGLWCLTYVGSWFNGMTLIIIGVVALFTLPKVYETNKAQIDQNVALVHGKINELTAKVKAAIPLGKKSEPTKEE